MRTTNKAAMLAATAVLGVGAGVGLAIAGNDTPETWQPQRTDAAVPATPEQKAAFATLGAEPGAGDADRALIRQLAERSRIGLDADGARVVGETATGPVWLAPANGGVCVAIEDTGGGSIGTACEGNGDVVDRGTTIGDGTHIYGVAPDGVDAVTVTPGDGPPQSVAVSEHGLYVLPSQDATVALDGPSGPVSFAVAG